MQAIAHILLVEDNLDDYEATLRSLKKSDITNPVHWCKGGQEALDYLNRAGRYTDDGAIRLPNLILLDLNMPGLDGRQVLERIKNDEKLKSIPVIILTTSSDSKDIERCYHTGASTYIQKPVKFDGLTETFRTMRDYWFGVALLPGLDHGVPQ
jgi:two-component system response regulator